MSLKVIQTDLRDGVIIQEKEWRIIASLLNHEMRFHGVIHIGDGEIDDAVVVRHLAKEYGRDATFVMVTRPTKDTGALLFAKRQLMMSVTGASGFGEWCDDDTKKDFGSLESLFNGSQRHVLFITSPCESLVPLIKKKVQESKNETVIVYYSGQYNTEHTPSMAQVANMDRVVFIDLSRFVLFSKLPNTRDLSNFQKVFPSEMWIKYANSPITPKIRAVIACLNLKLVAPKSLFAKPLEDETRLEFLNNVYKNVCNTGKFEEYIGAFTLKEFDAMKEVKRKILTAITTDAPIADSVIALMLFYNDGFRTTVTRGKWTASKEGFVTLQDAPEGRALTVTIDDDGANGATVMARLCGCFEKIFE